MHNVLNMDIDASYNTAVDPAATAGILIGEIVVYLVFAFILSRVFKKAGYNGWLALIPIVNSVILIRISGHSSWSILLLIIPVVNIVWSIVIALHLARSFGKSGVFGFFGLFLFSIIGYLILAFGSSIYTDRRTLAE